METVVKVVVMLVAMVVRLVVVVMTGYDEDMLEDSIPTPPGREHEPRQLSWCCTRPPPCRQTEWCSR